MKTKVNQFQKNSFSRLKKIFVLIVFVFVASCSKDDKAAPEVLATLQDPLTGFLQESGLNQELIISSLGGAYAEYGLNFSPLTNGKITAIVVKIPEARNELRVTIWNKATGDILRTERINITTAGIETTKQIEPINVEKGKDYAISINTNIFYARNKTDFSVISYPFTIGDIKIYSFNSNLGSAQVLPTDTLDKKIFGDFSFKFQK